LDKTIEQQVNEFVVDDDYDFILQQNDTLFGNFSYDTQLDLYYTY